MARTLDNATVVLSGGDNYDGEVTIHEGWVRVERANVARWYPARKVSKIKESVAREQSW